MSLDIAAALPDGQEYLMTRLFAEEGVSNSVVNLLKQILPKSSSMIQSFIPNLKELDDRSMISRLSTKEYKDVLHAMTGFSFMTYMDTLVMVPEGFSGKLTDYLKALIAQGKMMSQKAPKIVADYSLELSMFLSNSDIRMSLKSHEAHYKQVKEERLSYEQSIKTFFDPKFPTRSRLPIGNIMERFNDLEELYRLTEQLIGIQKDQKFKEMSVEVKKASEMLGLIKYRLDSEEIDNVSGQVAKNLATGAFEVAEYVEAVALFGYYSESAVASTQNITTKLTELFKIKK